MFNLTTHNLQTYLLRVVRNIVYRSSRFREQLGDVGIIYDNRLSLGDVQVLVRDLTADGRRLQADYFMATQIGRAIVTKVDGKDGLFIEWASEVDTTGKVLDAGVYYFNVDWVKTGPEAPLGAPLDAKINDVGFTIGRFKWREGRITNASGTIVRFRAGIDATQVAVTDLASGQTVPTTATQTSIQLLGIAAGVTCHLNGAALTPVTDFWIEQTVTRTLIVGTAFGTQLVQLPAGMVLTAILDGDGDPLRAGKDYILLSSDTVQLSAWTAAGQTLSAKGIVQLDPSIPANCLNPENTLQFTLEPNESLVLDQCFIYTQDDGRIAVTPNADGTVTLPKPLPSGGWCTYEVRIDAGQRQVQGRRGSIHKSMVPGLWVAIGDQVTTGDQCAILVSPTLTETYQVYGSQEGISFTLEVRANDPQTASDIVGLLKQGLLIDQRVDMESDGVTLFEANTSNQAVQRDGSGTSANWTYTMGFSGAAEWRVFKPLVTRVTTFDVVPVPQSPTGRITPVSRYRALGTSGFLPDYR